MLMSEDNEIAFEDFLNRMVDTVEPLQIALQPIYNDVLVFVVNHDKPHKILNTMEDAERITIAGDSREYVVQQDFSAPKPENRITVYARRHNGVMPAMSVTEGTEHAEEFLESQTITN